MNTQPKIVSLNITTPGTYTISVDENLQVQIRFTNSTGQEFTRIDTWWTRLGDRFKRWLNREPR